MSSESDFGYVVTMLANRLRPEPPLSPKVVFLLGAGCSKQYGLPSFQELLAYFWQDCYHEQPDSSWSFETLRDRLDQYWRTLGPKAREATLEKYLNRIDGKNCPAYLRLATLASHGRVKAIVNMNFDTLLEDALKVEQVPFLVSTSFTETSNKHLMIYKPHGSIGEVSPQRSLAQLICSLVSETIKRYLEEIKTCNADGMVAAHSELMQDLKRLEKIERETSGPNDLILDIANSDLFSNPEEQRLAQELLTEHDVVVLGYSGVDAKIVAALRAFAPEEDKRDKKLFAINISRPDPRLLLVMAERASQDLLVTGEDGGFENFMEFLERAVDGRVDFEAPSPSTTGYGLTFMTRSERAALAECLGLALSIRAEINVADRSSVTIEQHGHEIYRLCLKLANAAGDCLTPPEKFLLYAAAFLHDLGYFAAYSGGNVLSNPGWKLLNEHGQMTEALIRQRVNPSEPVKPVLPIMPATYTDHQQLLGVLCSICSHHSTWRTRQISKRKEEGPLSVQVHGRAVQVRPKLLQTLFAAAEDLAMEHPFLPSPDPVIANESESRWVVEDPVLDLFLRRKKDEVIFDIERGRVVGRTGDRYASKTALWILNDAKRYVMNYARQSCARDGAAVGVKHGAWGINFDCEPRRRLIPTTDEWESKVTDLLAVALEDGLSESLRKVQTDMHQEAAQVLTSASKELEKIQQDSAELAILPQVIDSVRRSLSRDWIFELYASGREVEALMNRLVRNHGRLFREAQQKIRELDSGVRERLRNNIPELARMRVWFRLPAIEGILHEIDELPGDLPDDVSVGSDRLERWGSILNDLQDHVKFLAESVKALPHEPSLSGLNDSLGKLHLEARKVCSGWLARRLEIVQGEMLSSSAPKLRPGEWRQRLAPALDYLRQMEKHVEEKQVLVLLARVVRGLGWEKHGIERDILPGLADSVKSSLGILQSLGGGKIESVKESAERDLKHSETLRRVLEERVVDEARSTLRKIQAVLEPRKAAAGFARVIELLDRVEENLARPAPSHVSSILDLLAIYTLGGQDGGVKKLKGQELEPRVSFNSETVKWTLGWIKNAGEYAGNSILDAYFRLKQKAPESLDEMEEALKSSFEKILYPAWRFFGRNLHDGIESILMAVVCLDFGSSRFRAETISGIRLFLAEKFITWSDGRACGHSGCTLCTSRLLYIFSHVRRLFPQKEFKGFVDPERRKIDEIVKGFLQYFLDRDQEDQAWWGLGCAIGGSKIVSADYLAWAARSVAFFLSVDRELEDRTGESWLDQIFEEADSAERDRYRQRLLTLLEQRWSAVMKMEPDRLLGEGAEEPHSIILGNVAIACLEILRNESQIRGLRLGEMENDLRALSKSLQSGIVKSEPLSTLSRFFVWPVRLLQDRVGYVPVAPRKDEEDPAFTAVEDCLKCIDSQIWIKDGPDTGSWGFNVKNTQAVVSSLIEFWRYAFAKTRRENFKKLFDQACVKRASAEVVSGLS